MKLTPKILLRVCTFGALTLVVLLGLNSFFQPVWSKWNNYYTTKGFYEEPENTIETLFLGASVMQSSVSPMQMYDEYGINLLAILNHKNITSKIKGAIISSVVPQLCEIYKNAIKKYLNIEAISL